MDPLSAVSLAASICAFIDFGCKLVSHAQEIYHSPDGTTSAFVNIETVVSDLRSLNQGIIGKKKAFQYTSKADLVLVDIASKCETEATELMKLLNSLKLSEDSNRWESFRKAIQVLRKKGRVAELEARLEKLQKQIDRRILYMMSDQQSVVFSWFLQLSSEHTRINIESRNQIEQLQDYIQSLLSQQTEHSRNLQHIIRKLEQLSIEGDRLVIERSILQSLLFDEWKRRFNQASKRHNQTFEWIFERLSKSSRDTGPLDFCQWLEKGNGIYWIAGKAGAGKSTLMKALVEDPRTLDCLKVWAKNATPVIIPWFFWSAGSPMQRSQLGLLQSILFQILRRCPQLIQTVCPARVAMYRNISYLSKTVEDWSFDELMEAFESLSNASLPDLRFCLFVDGLDEYEGLPNDLLRILKKLASSTHIKLCVASRPWNEFLVAFDENETEGSLRLEDHTRSDIEFYVRDILEKDDSFTAAERQDESYGDFISKVIDRARGVFLWVQLVVTSLLKGLGEMNKVDDLQRKLDTVPETLEKYFQQIFDRIDKTDWVESAKVFLVTAHATQPLSVVAYHFLEKEGKEPDFALTAPIHTIYDPEVRRISKEVHTRLNFLCKDLIEVNKVTMDRNYVDFQVDFTHRTVKDFLMTRDLRKQLMDRATEDGSVSWNPHQTLCSITLARIKTLMLQQGIQQGINTLFRLVDELLFYAYEVEINNKTSNAEILDELDRTISKYAEVDMSCHWTNARDPPVEHYFDEGNQNCFLALAIQARLCLYVANKLKLKSSVTNSKSGRPLLDYALRPILVTPAETPNFISYLEFDMVHLLLNHGADPNQRISLYGNITVWALFLLTCYFGAKSQIANDKHLRDIWFQAADIMIRKGADRTLRLETGKVERSSLVGSIKADSVIVKSARYKTALSNASQVSIRIPREVTVNEIMIEVFGEDRTARLNAIVPEKRSWNIMHWMGWKT